MWSDGATCGYCGCLPTRHSKKDARYSSDSIAGTSESASPEKWKDEDLGAMVPEVVCSSPSSLSEEFSTETDFIPEPLAETSKYG